jgi:hypothetical protein
MVDMNKQIYRNCKRDYCTDLTPLPFVPAAMSTVIQRFDKDSPPNIQCDNTVERSISALDHRFRQLPCVHMCNRSFQPSTLASTIHPVFTPQNFPSEQAPPSLSFLSHL